MSNIFPETLAPNFFHVDKLPDYGLKLFENELGREIRRYTEDTGYKTELKIQYNGLRSDEVKALTAFYLQVKGTFDKFTLPINFYRSPSSITNSLTDLADTTEWRFMNPPIIQTVISDIYTVEIRLLSLKDSLNPDSSKIIGFVDNVNVDFILPTILIPQQNQVTELVPIALEFIVFSIDLNQSVSVNSIDLTLETSELTFTTSTSGSVDSRSIQSLSLSFVASQTGFGILNSFEQMPSIIVSGTFTSLARYIHLVNTASGVASTTLPSDALDDTTIIYSDYAGTSTSSPTGFGLNAFTLNAPVGQTIQGQSSRVLNVENTSIQVVKKGNRWTIVGTELATGNSSGGSISLSDEGTQLTATTTSLNFTGAGVTATNSGGDVTVNVPGGGGGSANNYDDYYASIMALNPLFYFPLVNSFDNFGSISNPISFVKRENMKLLSEGGCRFVCPTNTAEAGASRIQMTLGSSRPNSFSIGFKFRRSLSPSISIYATIANFWGLDVYSEVNGSLASWNGTNVQFQVGLGERNRWHSIVINVTIGGSSTVFLNGFSAASFTATLLTPSSTIVTLGLPAHGGGLLGYWHDLKDVFMVNRLLTQTEIIQATL